MRGKKQKENCLSLQVKVHCCWFWTTMHTSWEISFTLPCFLRDFTHLIGLCCGACDRSKHLVMVPTAWLMAQETLPSCDETSVKSQYISIWERTVSKGYTSLKRLCHSSREKERERERGRQKERKADLLECRKIMLNYIIRELNRTVLIQKGKTLLSYRWLNSK